MASTLRLLAVTLLLFSFTTTATSSMEADELESMLNVLRAGGYNLFGNAISTSDVIFEVLSGKSFTFFAPTDSSLFTLDMTSTASEYISTLRCHVIPSRMSFLELRLFPSGSSLPTLVKNHPATVRFESRSSVTSSDDFITIDGVRIVFPDLFHSRNIAVHGLRGILNCSSNQDSTQGNQDAPSPTDSPVNDRGKSSSPPTVSNHSQAHPPSSNFSSSIDSHGSGNVQNPKPPSPSPANLLDDQGFNSTVVGEGQEKQSPLNSSNNIKSPSSTFTDHPDFLYPESEPPFGSGLSPASLAAEGSFLPQVSPAYDLWLEVPSYPNFVPSTEPGPPPEFSENDDPMAFPPSAAEAVEDQGSHVVVATGSGLSSMNENEFSPVDEDEPRSELNDLIPVTATVKMNGIMGKVPKKSEPLDEASFECPLIDGLDHASISQGLVTRQLIFSSSNRNVMNPIC